MLDIKVLSSQKPSIEFNFEDVSKYLDSQLQKYKDVVVTEESLKDGKKLVADLRKGSKALDDFRKKVKKELSEPIKQFENECKTLQVQFTETIEPIVDQLDHYEKERIESKRATVLDMMSKVENITNCHGIILKDKYLNKSMNKRQIEEDLFQQAKNIQLEQEYVEEQQKRISDMCKTCNKWLKKPILDDTYYFRLISNTEVDDIIQLIQDDCNHLKAIQSHHGITTCTSEIVAEPNVTVGSEVYTENYRITGSEEELDELQEYLSSHGFSWELVE